MKFKLLSFHTNVHNSFHIFSGPAVPKTPLSFPALFTNAVYSVCNELLFVSWGYVSCFTRPFSSLLPWTSTVRYSIHCVRICSYFCNTCVIPLHTNYRHSCLFQHSVYITLSPGTISGLSVQFNHSVVSDSLRPHESQHARPPCPSPTPRVYSNSCPLSEWCHPTILSSVTPFSSHLQSFPASRSFQMNQFFSSSGQSIGVPASASVLPMPIQDWFPLGWTGWISLQSKGLSRVFSNTTVQKHQFFDPQLSL